MGLDLMLDGFAPHAGREAECQALNARLAVLDDDDALPQARRQQLRAALRDELARISTSPYDVIGAPRVGFDARATEWFRVHCYKPNRDEARAQRSRLEGKLSSPFIDYWSRRFEQVLRDERGRYVVALAADKRGLSPASGILTSSLDLRGSLLARAESLPSDLQHEAFDDHHAQASLDYAHRLEEAVRVVPTPHRPDVEGVRQAIAWMRFWGERRFGWTAWY